MLYNMSNQNQTTIQLRIQTFLKGKYRQAMDIIYNIPIDRTEDALKILKEPKKKLSELK